MRNVITVNKFPEELDSIAIKKESYETIKHGTVVEYEVPYEDIEFLWGESSSGCQCSYYLVLINNKVYKYRSGCGWDKAVLARFENVQEYVGYCQLHKVDKRWLQRTPALKP